MSRSGNLTIAFSKPIVRPPVQVIDIETWREEYRGQKVKKSLRRLQDQLSLESNSTAIETLDDESQDLESLCAAEGDLPIMCLLDLTVHTDFYDEQLEMVEISRYDVTRLNSWAMDIQIDFKRPESITVSTAYPDFLGIDFLYDDLFIDETSFAPLNSRLEVDFEIPQQMSAEELAEIEALEKVLASSLAAFTLGNLGLNIVLAIGLKYLWNMIALIQFAIFMRDWQFSIPIRANIWLDALRTLALFEFIETEKIRKWF